MQFFEFMFTKVKLTELIGTVYFKRPALLCLNLQEAHLILLSINIFYLPLLNIATHSINHSLFKSFVISLFTHFGTRMHLYKNSLIEFNFQRVV